MNKQRKYTQKVLNFIKNQIINKKIINFSEIDL